MVREDLCIGGSLETACEYNPWHRLSPEGATTDLRSKPRRMRGRTRSLSLCLSCGRSQEIFRKLSDTFFAERRLFAQLDPGKLVRAPERLL